MLNEGEEAKTRLALISVANSDIRVENASLNIQLLDAHAKIIATLRQFEKCERQVLAASAQLNEKKAKAVEDYKAFRKFLLL